MAITSLTKHDNHRVRIHLTKEGSKHYGALRCVECDKHIQWLNKLQVNALKDVVEVISPPVVKWLTTDDLGI